jgi:hypothetical protein
MMRSHDSVPVDVTSLLDNLDKVKTIVLSVFDAEKICHRAKQ